MSAAGDFTFWAVVPAAGSSRRMNQGIPKQYLPLADRAVLEWSLAPFLARPECLGIVVVLAAGDTTWPTGPMARHAKVSTALGGQERADSVLAGLRALTKATERDWVAVHDAARPCLSAEDLQRLIDAVRNDEVGGLLAARVADTLKRADEDGKVAQTVSRESLWHALTPQMFRHGLLLRALTQALQEKAVVTDEAQAIERLGLRPRLVPGSADNIKITVAEDLVRAQRILSK